jgi:uncharacterized protein
MTDTVPPATTTASTLQLDALPLFPLQLVLFPGAQLALKIFEARYLDLVSNCMRQGQPFGVVCLRAGDEAGHSTGAASGATANAKTDTITGKPAVQLHSVGTLAHIEELDAEQTGILRLRCVGGQRFKITGDATQRSNGLWVAPVQLLRPDPARAPGPAVQPAVQALADAIQQLLAHDHAPFAPPYRLEDAGWVANRWCELLPVDLDAKQKLMEMDDPLIRLSLVDGFLRDKKIVVG